MEYIVEETILSHLKTILKDVPPGAWVAISHKYHAAMAYGDDLMEVMAESSSEGEEDPLIMRAPNGMMMGL